MAREEQNVSRKRDLFRDVDILELLFFGAIFVFVACAGIAVIVLAVKG